MSGIGIFLAAAGFGLPMACIGLAAQNAQPAGAFAEIHDHEQVVQNPPEQSNGFAWWRLAIRYQDAARYSDAERAYAKALQMLGTSDSVVRANVMDAMGTMYVQMGRFTDAEALERGALSLRTAEKDSLGVGLSWMHLSMLSLGEHRNTEGEMYAELAVERLVPSHITFPDQKGSTPEQRMTALTYLALARCAEHRCSAALPVLRTAMTIAETVYPQNSFPVSYIEFLEGYGEWKAGKSGPAAKQMRDGIKGMEAGIGLGHPTYVSALRQYEEFLEQTGRNAEGAEVKLKLERIEASQNANGQAMTGRIAPPL